MPSYGPTYQDYLRLMTGGGGMGDGAMTAAQWAALDPRTRANTIGGGMVFDPNDPRYADLYRELGGEAGRNIIGVYGDPRTQPNFELTDPSKFYQSDGYSFYKTDNETPGMQRGEEQPWNYAAILAAALAPVALGYGAEALAGAGAGGAGAGAGGITGIETIAPLEATTVGSLGPGFSLGEGAAAAGGAGAAGAAGSAGGGGAAAGGGLTAGDAVTGAGAAGAGSGAAGGGGAAAGAGSGAAGGAAGGLGDILNNPVLRAALPLITNAVGGGRSNGGSSSMYVPTGQANADTDWQALERIMQGQSVDQAALLAPYLRGAFDRGAGLTTDLGNRMNNYGTTLEGRGMNAYGASDALRGSGDTIWNAAADPEGALRARTLHQITDSVRGASSARGLGMSAQSAGLENDATKNFALDWNDRQLQRLLAGGSGRAGMYDAAGRQDQLGNSDLTGAAGMYQGSIGLPFNLATGYAGATGAGIYNPLNMAMGNQGYYMGLGQNAAMGAFGQQQTNLNNWTTALGQVGNSGLGSWLTNFFGSGNQTPPAGGGGFSGDPAEGFTGGYNSGNYG